jgi:hypothetical protein
MIKAIEDFLHRRNTSISLRIRKDETKVLFNTIIKHSNLSGNYILDAYLNGINSYRNGLDVACIFYCGLAVELALITRITKSGSKIPDKFWQLIERAERIGILTDGIKDKAVSVEELRNIYVHLQTLLYYLAASAKRELDMWQITYSIYNDPISRKDRNLKRAFKYVKNEYDEKQATYAKLKVYSNGKVSSKKLKFMQDRELRYSSFISRKHDFLRISSINDKDYKKWKKVQQISKTLDNGDRLGLYDAVRFDAITQLEWSFEVLKELEFFDKNYSVYYDTYFINKDNGKFVVYKKPDYY